MSWYNDPSRACLGVGLEAFYPEFPEDPTSEDATSRQEQEKQAKRVCGRCPVQRECLEFALSFGRNEQHGVWGGLDERERRKLLTPKVGRPRAECGTYAAYRRHIEEGETPDPDCIEARERDLQRKRAERARRQQQQAA